MAIIIVIMTNLILIVFTIYIYIYIYIWWLDESTACLRVALHQAEPGACKLMVEVEEDAMGSRMLATQLLG